MKDTPKKLNAKAYMMMVKKEKALNQWLEEQLKTKLIVESSSIYTTLCFYISKKDRYLQLA